LRKAQFVVANLALVAALLVPTFAAAQSSDASAGTAKLKVALQQELVAYLKDRGVKEHLSSLSLTVSSKKGAAPINVVAGTTTYGGKTLVTPTSLYQIGSNTKAFTAVAILQLEAKGRLSIDAPLGKYLPQYPKYATLTLRRLLDMSAGIQSYDNTPAWEKMYASDPTADVPSNTLIRLVYPQVRSTPGSEWFYSNTGYLLAQEVVDKLSDSKSYAKDIARIAASVGLKNTYYTSHLYPPAIAARVVAGYYENNDAGFGKFIGKNMTPYSLSWAQGAGAIVSTPEDLTLWARALYDNSSLLPEKQREELKTLISTKTAKQIDGATATDPGGFGLGVAQRYMAALGAFWFYQGETLGFRAAHLYFPDTGLVVAVFANSRVVEKESHTPQLFETIFKTIKANGKL
jgi:D-alanyl-D-alanine carboxypeptidase